MIVWEMRVVCMGLVDMESICTTVQITWPQFTGIVMWALRYCQTTKQGVKDGEFDFCYGKYGFYIETRGNAGWCVHFIFCLTWYHSCTSIDSSIAWTLMKWCHVVPVWQIKTWMIAWKWHTYLHQTPSSRAWKCYWQTYCHCRFLFHTFHY